MQKYKVLNTSIAAGTHDDFLNYILHLVNFVDSSFVCVANVHMLIEANDSDSFQGVLNQADLVIPDGMPIAKARSLLHGMPQARLAGMDLIVSLLSLSEQNNIPVYLFGSTQAVVNKIILKAKADFPAIQIDGDSPPFRELSYDENSAIIRNINLKKPGLVLVSLGCPKQERWMSENKGRVKACMVGLGGAFPVYAGEVARAPKIMQKYGLEWLYRLIKEPRRLWKRYVYTNTKFIYLFSKQYLLTKVRRGQ